MYRKDKVRQDSCQDVSHHTEHDITRQVRQFYEKVNFPGTRPLDQDGLILMKYMMRSITKGSGDGGEMKMRILDAGCGTGNTVLALAREFKKTQFTGVDLSARSLEICRNRARKEKIDNVRFLEGDLMNRDCCHGPFDIILCLGVLHHTASMPDVLENLGQVLEERGQLILWVYGRHGRYRHALNKRLLSMLLGDEIDRGAAVDLAREFAVGFGNGDALADLFGEGISGQIIEEVLENPSWVADQYLHPREVLLDMEGLLDLIDGAGLSLQQWLGIPSDISGLLTPGVLRERFKSLEGRQKFVALDLLLKPSRYFVVLQRET
jgi:ubiquinone/menaquinone biosynthesis C-methylase UbiE